MKNINTDERRLMREIRLLESDLVIQEPLSARGEQVSRRGRLLRPTQRMFQNHSGDDDSTARKKRPAERERNLNMKRNRITPIVCTSVHEDGKKLPAIPYVGLKLEAQHRGIWYFASICKVVASKKNTRAKSAAEIVAHYYGYGQKYDRKLVYPSDQLRTCCSFVWQEKMGLQPKGVSSNESLRTQSTTVDGVIFSDSTEPLPQESFPAVVEKKKKNHKSNKDETTKDNQSKSRFKCHRPIATWTVGEVASYVEGIPGCARYANKFKQGEIDGAALVLITERHLLSNLGVKLGPALKILAHIEALQTNPHM